MVDVPHDGHDHQQPNNFVRTYDGKKRGMELIDQFMRPMAICSLTRHHESRSLDFISQGFSPSLQSEIHSDTERSSEVFFGLDAFHVLILAFLRL